MTNFVLTGGAYAEQTLSFGEKGIVGTNAIIVADTDDGVDGDGGTGTVALDIDGSIYATGQNKAVYLHNGTFDLLIGTSGRVYGGQNGGAYSTAIFMSNATGNSNVTNMGVVSGPSAALWYTGTSDSSLSLNNSGKMTGHFEGVFIQGGQTAHIVNSGEILGAEIGVKCDTPAQNMTIVNSGYLQGEIKAIELFSLNDTVRNKGEIWGASTLGDGADVFDNRMGYVEGNIHLDAGADKYDGRGGAVIGAVFGDAGKDTFIGNAAEAETFDGGADSDTLVFRFGPAVTIALDERVENDGAALGDTYIGFENVIGSLKADFIRGDVAANSLIGQGGADTILGMGGNDSIRGGFGGDTLTGGLGDDTFRYALPEERGDVITDFHNAAGDNDVFQFSVGGFGGGMALGTLSAGQFQVRADNLAQDSNDRFIYRTTDQTLWFDANGNAAGGAVMIADLQSGATMTSADIYIIA